MRDSSRVSAFDGIRALGAIAVIASHLHPDGPLAAGWISPDTFFVLSGFLITGLLLAERRRTGRIRLLRMWERRAARLYPALVLTIVLAALLPVGLRVSDVVHALLYVTDLSPDVDGQRINPLAHTWSLGVQEQFYILWPIALVLARTRRAQLVVALSGAAASFGIMVWLAGPGLTLEDSPAYYAPHARLWELLVGSVLAVLLPFGLPTSPHGQRMRRVLAWTASAGMTVTLVAAVARPGQWMVLSVATVACVSAMVVAIGGPGSPRVEDPALPVRALGWRPLTWLGERSYGLYLFHVPLMLSVPRLPFARHGLGTVIIVAADVLLSALSYRWVELPLRDLAARTRGRRPEGVPRQAVRVSGTADVDREASSQADATS